MYDRADAAGARAVNNRANRGWMVVNRCLVQRPQVRSKVDAGAPVFQPNVIAILDQCINHGLVDRRTKNVGSDARAVRKHDRALRGRSRAFNVNEVALEAVPGDEGNDGIMPTGYFGGTG